MRTFGSTTRGNWWLPSAVNRKTLSWSISKIILKKICAATVANWRITSRCTSPSFTSLATHQEYRKRFGSGLQLPWTIQILGQVRARTCTKCCIVWGKAFYGFLHRDLKKLEPPENGGVEVLCGGVGVVDDSRQTDIPNMLIICFRGGFHVYIYTCLYSYAPTHPHADADADAHAHTHIVTNYHGLVCIRHDVWHRQILGVSLKAMQTLFAALGPPSKKLHITQQSLIEYGRKCTTTPLWNAVVAHDNGFIHSVFMVKDTGFKDAYFTFVNDKCKF